MRLRPSFTPPFESFPLVRPVESFIGSTPRAAWVGPHEEPEAESELGVKALDLVLALEEPDDGDAATRRGVNDEVRTAHREH